MGRLFLLLLASGVFVLTRSSHWKRWCVWTIKRKYAKCERAKQRFISRYGIFNGVGTEAGPAISVRVSSNPGHCPGRPDTFDGFKVIYRLGSNVNPRPWWKLLWTMPRSREF